MEIIYIRNIGGRSATCRYVVPVLACSAEWDKAPALKEVPYRGAQSPSIPYPLASFHSLVLILPMTPEPRGLGSPRGWTLVTRWTWRVHILLCSPV